MSSTFVATHLYSHFEIFGLAKLSLDSHLLNYWWGPVSVGDHDSWPLWLFFELYGFSINSLCILIEVSFLYNEMCKFECIVWILTSVCSQVTNSNILYRVFLSSILVPFPFTFSGSNHFWFPSWYTSLFFVLHFIYMQYAAPILLCLDSFA